MTPTQYIGALLVLFAFCGLVLTVAEILHRRAQQREEQEAENRFRKICEDVEREAASIAKNCKGRR